MAASNEQATTTRADVGTAAADAMFLTKISVTFLSPPGQKSESQQSIVQDETRPKIPQKSGQIF